MKLSRADFPQLKWSVITFLAALCASGIAIAASKNFVSHAQREQQVSQQQLGTVRSRLAAAEEDSKNIKAYTSEYGELLKRNLIGDDQRLDWIEGLEKIRNRNLVLDFKYRIAPQHSYIPPIPLDKGNFELNMSDMNLQFDLLHEEQLINFFDTLRTDINGWFILEHCTMERSTDSDATAQLKAECTGGWLTLKNRNEK